MKLYIGNVTSIYVLLKLFLWVIHVIQGFLDVCATLLTEITKWVFLKYTYDNSLNQFRFQKYIKIIFIFPLKVAIISFCWSKTLLFFSWARRILRLLCAHHLSAYRIWYLTSHYFHFNCISFKLCYLILTLC